MRSKAYSLYKLLIRRFLVIACQIFKLFPVKKNRIVFICHKYGSQYADSPMYISEYLMQHYADRYEIIWVFKEPDRFEYLKAKGIKLVKFCSLAGFYYSNTAKVYITNLFGPYPDVIRRKNRIIIETSHGVAYKNLLTGASNVSKVDSYDIEQRRIKINMCDYALSGCDILTRCTYRDNLGYEGRIIEEGLPRNDLFFRDNGEIKRKVRQRYGIAPEAGILLLMPTWKKENSRRTIEIDYGRVLDLLGKKDGREWVCLLRLHHLSRVDISDILSQYAGRVIEATDYPDPQELLLAGDALMTDYSSVVWDFALQKKPIFIYTPDVLDYSEERGFNVPPAEWGLFRAEGEEELYRMIEEHTLDEIARASQAHLEKFGNCETGKATERLCRRIDRYCGGGEF